MRARTERRNDDVEPIGDSWGNGQAWPALARKLHSKYCVKYVVRRWWQRVAEDWRNGPIGLEVGKGTVIDAGVGGNIARYINHACKPNAYIDIKDGVIWIRAARTIRRGEETKQIDVDIGQRPETLP